MSNQKPFEKPIKFDTPMKEVIKKVAKVKKEGVPHEPDDPFAPVAQEGELQLALFKGKQIRQVFHNNEWFFSIVDAIEAIVETDRPRKYWSDLKTQLLEKEGFIELSEKIGQLKMPGTPMFLSKRSR